MVTRTIILLNQNLSPTWHRSIPKQRLIYCELHMKLETKFWFKFHWNLFHIGKKFCEILIKYKFFFPSRRCMTLWSHWVHYLLRKSLFLFLLLLFFFFVPHSRVTLEISMFTLQCHSYIQQNQYRLAGNRYSQIQDNCQEMISNGVYTLKTISGHKGLDGHNAIYHDQ